MTDPGKVVCVGPKYQYAYTPDGLHLDAAGYRRLGEKYAEVFDHVVERHEAWAPLEPTSVRRDGLRIVVHFHVPVPPLTWDETLSAPHQGAFTPWASGRGFEVTDDDVPATIVRVALEGSDSVVVTLQSVPRGRVALSYATVQDAHRYAGGDVLGRRGQLTDSDFLLGWDAETLACEVENGSNRATTLGTHAFAAWTRRDLVQGAGLPSSTIVLEKLSDDAIDLSDPWQGPTGKAMLRFHYDERNYAVAFRMPVP